jgi:hypothetical protein
MTPEPATTIPSRSSRSWRYVGRAQHPLRSWASLVHLAPYVGLATLGAALLAPGVLPSGSCDIAPTPSVNNFIAWSALAFAAVVLLFMASAVVASAQRRGSGLAGAGAWGAFAVAVYAALAGLFPHSGLEVVAELLMALVVIAVAEAVASPVFGLILILMAVGLVAMMYRGLRGRPLISSIQLAAWLLPFTVVPLIMGIAYITATPVCMD